VTTYELAEKLLSNGDNAWETGGRFYLSEIGRPVVRVWFIPSIPNDGSYKLSLPGQPEVIPQLMGGKERHGYFTYFYNKWINCNVDGVIFTATYVDPSKIKTS
jgi:hypothetical protein